MKPLKRSVLPLDEQRVLERRQGSSFPHLTAKSCKSSGLPRLSSKQPLWGLTQKKKLFFSSLEIVNLVLVGKVIWQG